MAVQFPNFLAAQLVKPDYSGLSDIFENYYSGKDLPRRDIINEYAAKGAPLDYLMKQIQSEFARPNAEVALQGAKLGNQSSNLGIQQAALQIQQLKKQIAEQASVDNAIKQALRQQQGGQGGGMQGGGGYGGVSSMQEAPTEDANVANSANGMNQGIVNPQGMFKPELSQAIADIMKNPMMKNQPVPTQSPLMNEHPEGMQPLQTKPNQRFQELEPGNTSLYGIDQLWDSNPYARPAIEKRFGKKEVKKIYDKATGATRIETTWPSQRITVKTIMPMQQEESGEIPLTKPVLNKAVMQVRGTDAVIPYIDKLIDMATPKKSAGGVVNESELPYFWWHPTNAGANYEGIMNEAADKYLTATGLNVTDQSIQTVKHILERGKGESDKNYLKRLKELKQAKIKERAQNIKMIDKGLSKFGNAEINASNGSNQSYSSDEWEQTNER
jgi:DNA-binding transcriptional MerR regulator